MIWIFTEGEGDGIEPRLPFKSSLLYDILHYVSFILQECKSCKIAKLFIVSVSLAGENIRGLRELFLMNNPAKG